MTTGLGRHGCECTCAVSLVIDQGTLSRLIAAAKVVAGFEPRERHFDSFDVAMSELETAVSQLVVSL